VQRILAAILTVALLPAGGGCTSWFKKDSLAARADELPSVSPSLRRLVELEKRQKNRSGKGSDITDPRFMERRRRQSEKAQEKALRDLAKARKAYRERVRREKKKRSGNDPK